MMRSRLIWEMVVTIPAWRWLGAGVVALLVLLAVSATATLGPVAAQACAHAAMVATSRVVFVCQ